MKPFVIDHDLHIHSNLSICCDDPRQTPEVILFNAKMRGLKDICLTNHHWDDAVPCSEVWYRKQNWDHISKALPLPQDPDVRFHFGCEIDMDKCGVLGIAPEHFDRFDFIIVPTTHLNFRGFTIAEEDCATPLTRAKIFVKRLEWLLDAKLPEKKKVGLAHITCELAAWDSFEDHLVLYDSISDATYADLFRGVRDRGIGFELNFSPDNYKGRDLDRILRPYFVAKDVGCKFYLGGDAHTWPEAANVPHRFEQMVKLLDLHEEDKFIPEY